ncbi:MAG: hypothetical protein AAGA76_13260 [Pseudomonadota bacterium]
MTCTGQQYLGRPSEHLVLEGYRLWSSGIITGDYSNWDSAWNLFAVKLGVKEGRLALNALTRFTKTLGLCAACPLKTSPVGCYSLCRDEVLILGLLSGIQHDDETVITLCLDALACPKRCEEVLLAAEFFATIMRTLNKLLLPVPANTIKAILTENISTSTLH